MCVYIRYEMGVSCRSFGLRVRGWFFREKGG